MQTNMIIRQTLRLGTTVQRMNPKRNATVFKRVYPPKRLPGNPTQDEINKIIFCEEETKTFTHFRYDIVEETDAEPGEMKVLLLKTTEEFGRRGQIRSINARTARQELLLPGFGVYASPYNLEKYKKIVLPEDSVQSSSETVSQCVSDLQKFVVPIVMSGNNRWTLDKWHVKFALLNQGILLEENCIKIPEEKISGPNEAIEGGEFLLMLKINDFETIKVRAVLFQKSLEKLNAEIPPIGWDKRFYQPIFSEEAAELRLLPRHNITMNDVMGYGDASEILEQFALWKDERDKKLFSS